MWSVVAVNLSADGINKFHNVVVLLNQEYIYSVVCLFSTNGLDTLPQVFGVFSDIFCPFSFTFSNFLFNFGF